MGKLTRSFYQRPNVITIARDLLGKTLFTRLPGPTGRKGTCGGVIVETEAYAGINDRASHAYGGRRTNRTEIMYARGGTAYVYLCYGIHSLFNVVTNKKGIPHAILVRAISPARGIPLMLKRRGKDKPDSSLATGPGTLSEALGITVKYTGSDLLGPDIWIEDTGVRVNPREIETSPRIGVDYAGPDAKLPYRFTLRTSL